VCLVAPATLISLQINQNPKFTALDEVAEFDYVQRIAQGGFPREGQQLLHSTLRELVCRGNELNVPGPKCDAAHLPADKFPGGTGQYEAQQAPVYYAAAVPLRWVTENVFRVNNTLDATRATNIFWLVAGLLLAWAAGRLMDIDPVPLGAGLILLAAAPVVVYGAAGVNSDVTASTAGGLVAFVAAFAYRRERPRMWIVLSSAGFAAVILKTTNLFAVVAVSALFAVAAITKRAGAERWMVSIRRWLRDGGALLAGGIAAAVIWSLIFRWLSLIQLYNEPEFGALRLHRVTPGQILREATFLFQPLTGYVSKATLGQDVQVPVFAVLNFLIIGAALAGLFVTPRRWSHVLGLLALPTLFIGGVVFGVGLKITYRIDPGLSGRYGLSMIPLLVIVLAAELKGRWAQGAMAAFGVALFTTTLAVMVWPIS
jgi:hypothetical protein